MILDFNFLLKNHFKILNIATTLYLKTMHGGACEFEKVIWTIFKNSKKSADNDDDDEEEERIKSEDHTRWHDDILTSFSWWITFSPFCDKAWKRWVPWNWWTTKMHHRVSQKISFFHDSWAFREIEWDLIVVSVQIIIMKHGALVLKKKLSKETFWIWVTECSRQ